MPERSDSNAWDAVYAEHLPIDLAEEVADEQSPKQTRISRWMTGFYMTSDAHRSPAIRIQD